MILIFRRPYYPAHVIAPGQIAGMVWFIGNGTSGGEPPVSGNAEWLLIARRRGTR